MYNAIDSLNSNTESCVSLNGLHTEWFNCTNGVRQGENLSPTLFSIFINDLANEIKEANRGISVNNDNIFLLLYADDIMLLVGNENDKQHVLDVHCTWCEKWRIIVNISKFNVMHFRRGHLPRSAFYNQPLPIVEQYRYLGVIFHEKMKFREAAETLPKGGGRALRAAIFEIGFKTFESLFYSCVTPVLDYCSGVWDFNNFSCVDNVQNRALRSLTYIIETRKICFCSI